IPTALWVAYAMMLGTTTALPTRMRPSAVSSAGNGKVAVSRCSIWNGQKAGFAVSAAAPGSGSRQRTDQALSPQGLVLRSRSQPRKEPTGGPGEAVQPRHSVDSTRSWLTVVPIACRKRMTADTDREAATSHEHVT